jgi:hypothetical protein
MKGHPYSHPDQLPGMYGCQFASVFDDLDFGIRPNYMGPLSGQHGSVYGSALVLKEVK